MANSIAALDHHADRLSDTLRRNNAVAASCIAVSNAAVYSLIWLLLGVALLASGQHPRLGVQLLTLVPAEFVLTNGPVKLLVRRARPYATGASELMSGVLRPRTSSFPSGHASAASFVSTLMIGQAWAPGAIALAAAICLSRVVVGVHHASDVIGGMAWGICLGVAVRLVM